MDANANFNPSVPPGSRVYAIGDVHGRADLLARLLDAIEADASTPGSPARRVLVLLGDLVDRGPDSRAVLACAANLLAGARLPGFEVHVLKGNHEDMMLSYLDGADDGEMWFANGGLATLESLGVDAALPATRLREALAAALGPELLRMLRDLEPIHVEGDYAFVHAGVRPGVALDAQDKADLMWIRDAFIFSDKDFGRVVVHGHTPRDRPEVRANRIGIDTRAWASGELTCLALEGMERRFIAT